MPSSVAGYLTPATQSPPLQDDALDDFLGDVIAGITGLDRNLVRPRWQEEPPNLPPRNVTWCGVGVTNFDPDTQAYTGLAADGLSQTFIRHETITVMASFYGPLSGTIAGQFRDGLLIPQNNEALATAGFGYISTSGPTSTPELIKEKWLSRSDITWLTRREIDRVYPVLSLVAMQGTLYSDPGRAQGYALATP